MQPTLISMFKPEAKNLNKLFGNVESFYEIPDYQRSYSWESDQIEVLWEDIFEAFNNQDETYFLGPIILIKRKDYYEVIDGQQRLATLTILFSTIRDLYRRENKELENMIRSVTRDKFRLKVNNQDQNKFEKEILKKVDFPFSKIKLSKKERDELLKKSHFLNAACIFREKLSKVESFLDEFLNFLLNKVVVITITCSDQSFAIKLFQVLNTRGLDLTTADLIKSYLISSLKQDKRKQFSETWGQIKTLAEKFEESIDDLLTYFANFLLTRRPKKALYDELAKELRGKDGNEVAHNFKLFVDSYWDLNLSTSKIIFSLYYLPHDFWKIVLISAKYKSYRSFSLLVKELRNFYYSYWIAGYTSTKVRNFSFNLVQWIKENRPITEIRKEIQEKLVHDEVVENAIDKLDGDFVYGNRWLKPILAILEYEKTDDSIISFIKLDKDIHADHILPQGWVKITEWKKSWTTKQADTWLDTLGNLTLISGKKNIRASNKSFKEKKKIYNGLDGITAFEISKEIAKCKRWEEVEVKNRHDLMIKQLTNIFNWNSHELLQSMSQDQLNEIADSWEIQTDSINKNQLIRKIIETVYTDLEISQETFLPSEKDTASKKDTDSRLDKQDIQKYSWSTYKNTLKITDENIRRAEELSHEVDKILEGLDLKHVKKQFNKHYVSYKNKSRNVLTIEFCHDTTPGLGFHISKKPSKLGINLPKNVLDNGEWYPKYKQYFVPIIYLKIKIADLKPLFIEAKRYRG